MLRKKYFYLPSMREDGQIDINKINVVFDGEDEIARNSERTILQPNESFSGSEYPTYIQDIAERWWQDFSGSSVPLEDVRDDIIITSQEFEIGTNLLYFESGSVSEVTFDNSGNAEQTSLAVDIQNLLNELPPNKKIKYEILLSGGRDFRNTNKDIMTVAYALGMSDSNVDDFFRKSKKL